MTYFEQQHPDTFMFLAILVFAIVTIIVVTGTDEEAPSEVKKKEKQQ